MHDSPATAPDSIDPMLKIAQDFQHDVIVWLEQIEQNPALQQIILQFLCSEEGKLSKKNVTVAPELSLLKSRCRESCCQIRI
ncbi:MAG: hypothetical protein EXR81_01435 [Gammaproteobacteria bacterium]|nr:hypothetical protein [Gammaproteobacteria bacterium]